MCTNLSSQYQIVSEIETFILHYFIMLPEAGVVKHGGNGSSKFRDRANWTATAYSVLCSKHFSDERFEVEHKLASSFGLMKISRRDLYM